jgi:hypothetical protein
VLVADLADDLLEDVLDGHQPVDAAVLVNDERHVAPQLACILRRSTPIRIECGT